MIFPVARWFVWDPCISPVGSVSAPDVSFVEPLLRRRLSSLARMSLRVAYDCAHDIPNARFVFASQHGELARTVTMLESLAEKEALSPAVFSMSVLNASAGLFSILQKNVAPSTAISAGCSSFGYGLLEAGLQLASNPQLPVLFIYADESVPAVYGQDDQHRNVTHAVGLLLQTSAEMHIHCTTSSNNDIPSDEAQSRAFVRCLEQGHADWHDAGKTWFWEKECR